MKWRDKMQFTPKKNRYDNYTTYETIQDGILHQIYFKKKSYSLSESSVIYSHHPVNVETRDGYTVRTITPSNGYNLILTTMPRYNAKKLEKIATRYGILLDKHPGYSNVAREVELDLYISNL